MNNLEELYNSISSSDERAEFAVQALLIAADCIKESAKTGNELTSLKEENTALNARIEKAKVLWQNAKADAVSASAKERQKIYSSLQIVRDRLYVIGDTVYAAGKHQAEKGEPVSATELNNVIASLEIIIDELKANNLWTDTDALPPLARIEECGLEEKMPVKKAKSKKTKIDPITAEESAPANTLNSKEEIIPEEKTADIEYNVDKSGQMSLV